MRNAVSILFFALLFLAGCDSETSYDKQIKEFASQYANEVDMAKKYLTMLQAKDFAAIEEKIDPSLKNDQLHSQLVAMAAVFPAGSPTNVKLIGLHRNDFSNGANSSSTTAVTFEDDFSGKWLQTEVVLDEKNNNLTISGIHVLPLPGALENINKFTLKGQNIVNYIILMVACVVPIFILIALTVCIKTPVPKRKWLWVLFILFGFVSIQLNWTDSTIHINPLYFQLFGVGFAKSSPYSPVILAVSVPLGAIIFFFKRKKWIIQKVL